MGTMKTKTPEQIEAKRAADRAYQAKKRAEAKADRIHKDAVKDAKTPLKLTGTPGPTAPLPRREVLTDADITGMVRRSHLKEEKEAPAVKTPKGEPKRRGRAPKVELSVALTNEIVKRHRAGESFNDIAIDLDARGVEGILRVTKGRPKDVGGHVYSAFHKATGWREGKAWRGAHVA